MFTASAILTAGNRQLSLFEQGKTTQKLTVKIKENKQIFFSGFLGMLCSNLASIFCCLCFSMDTLTTFLFKPMIVFAGYPQNAQSFW